MTDLDDRLFDAQLLDAQLLDDRLLDAHARGAHVELVDLYGQAADAAKNVDAKCFYLTHAYIFALELGHPDALKLRGTLEQFGRH